MNTLTTALKAATWRQLFREVSYTCGHCGVFVSTTKGWSAIAGARELTRISLCTRCGRPTFFDAAGQIPAVPFGKLLEHLPDNVMVLYDEARKIAGASPTASVLACRKLLMHIAVEKGAKPGEKYEAYVDFLAKEGYIPPDGKKWVDQIRRKGNEANHEIVIMTRKDAERLLTFVEMLLSFVYEFPDPEPGDT